LRQPEHTCCALQQQVEAPVQLLQAALHGNLSTVVNPQQGRPSD
jgi:hypothetical protein